MKENSTIDKKSLLALTKANPDWNEVAKDCVCFANAYGGKILYGIEDNADLPPVGQRIPSDLPAKLQKMVQSRTMNVSVIPQTLTAENGGEYLQLVVQRTASTVAATSDGRYYMRVDDVCKPILPDELLRLTNDRSAFLWETQAYLRVPREDYDPKKLNNFVTDIQKSDRVSSFVKEKNVEELLEHYLFVNGDYLTNLGVLWIGKQAHRARLLYAPTIQFIKYDENERKVNKLLWDDYSLNPKEMLEAVWREIPDWQEGIEITDGLFRKKILNYDEVVIRELLANALAHRPYTIRGDIFLNLFQDRLEIHNPGLLPLGVTPQNILHKSVQRNPHLTRVFYDLKLMEKEGSGYDRMYENLLTNGKRIPKVEEDRDRVIVTVEKRIINEEVIQFLEKVLQLIPLKSKEIISLGLIAQNNALNAVDFAKILGIEKDDEARNWIGQLIDLELIKTRGRTKGTIYFVEPNVLKKHEFKGLTNLRKIEPHRLKQLILEDLERYDHSSIGDIHQRVGKEIPEHIIRNMLNELADLGEIFKEGNNRGRKYYLKKRPK